MLVATTLRRFAQTFKVHHTIFFFLNPKKIEKVGGGQHTGPTAQLAAMCYEIIGLDPVHAEYLPRHTPATEMEPKYDACGKPSTGRKRIPVEERNYRGSTE